MIAALLDGFQTIGAVGGQVEPGSVTKRPGCSSAIGFNAMSFTEAELDRRELALAHIAGTVVIGAEDDKSYSDVFKTHKLQTHVYTTQTYAYKRNTCHWRGGVWRSVANPAASSGKRGSFLDGFIDILYERPASHRAIPTLSKYTYNI